MLRMNHSTLSAKTFGVLISTVDGRFTIILSSTVGFQTAFTASTISIAYSISVPVKLSGEYSKRMLEPAIPLRNSTIKAAASTAILVMPALSELKTIFLCAVDVELYIWTIAFFTPFNDSNVLRIRCSLACVRTCIVTSSGICPPSINVLTKSKSTCDADGKATSISLNPMSTSILNIFSLFSTFMGEGSAWLPSRRSTLTHTGALEITLSGQVRPGISTAG